MASTVTGRDFWKVRSFNVLMKPPYGLPSEMDTPANNAKVDHCVSELTAKGTPKENAIRICKSAIMDAHRKKHGAKKK